jgi:hypothetical protein
MTWKIGQKVLCVSDNFDADRVVAVGGNVPHKVIWPVRGRQYTIADIRNEKSGMRFLDGCTGLVLEELPHPQGFDDRAFRAFNEDAKVQLIETERAT